MTVEFENEGKQKVVVRYVIDGVPCVVEENYLDNGERLAEFLQDQESVYQSLQGNTQNNVANASPSTGSRPHCDHGQSSGSNAVGISSEAMNVEFQLALDEAVARSLQEMENNHISISVDEPATVEDVIPSNHADGGSTSFVPSVLAASQDDINPDDMTYEERQALGEVIGTQSRGLTDMLISRLESYTYKTKFFSRKDKHEECVICLMPFKKGEKMITLPCVHHYHSHCITQWLKMNKVCPICKEEVSVS